MKLNIEIHESLPPEYHDKVEPWLREAIDFVESFPRHPSPDYLQPNFDLIKFTAGAYIRPIGLFNNKTGKGWAHLIIRPDGRLILESNPCKTIENQDVHIAAVSSWCYFLDQWFYPTIEQDLHYSKQLTYLESKAPALASDIKKQLMAEGVKRRNAERRKSRHPGWVAQKHPLRR